MIKSPTELDMASVQKRRHFRIVSTWIEHGCTEDLTYASFEPEEYHTKLTRLRYTKLYYCVDFWMMLADCLTLKFVFMNIYAEDDLPDT